MSGDDAGGHEGRLGFLEATSVIAGYGIGGGVLALPWLVSLNGVLPSAAVLAAAYLLSLLLHLMIAELAAGDGSGRQIIELLGTYLFRGPLGAALTWLFFGIMGVVLLTNLAAYVSGGGEVLAAIGVGATGGSILFYAAAASVAAFGLKVLGVAEKWAVIAMGLLFAGLVIASGISLAATGPAVPTTPPAPGAYRLLALYGMSMFCFAAFFSVPQAVRGLSDRPRLITTAVAAGLGVNLGLILVVCALTLLLCPEPTKIATVGWARTLGPLAELAGAAFVVLAMLTSYWSISFALADIVRERLGTRRMVSWLAATAPTLLLALAGFGGFMDFMRTAGGGIAVLVAVLIVPTYRSYRRGKGRLVLLPPVFANPHWDWIAVLAYVAMAIGSLVPV